jgi:hypothetical protein
MMGLQRVITTFDNMARPNAIFALAQEVLRPQYRTPKLDVLPFPD